MLHLLQLHSLASNPRGSSVSATLVIELQVWTIEGRFYMGAGDLTLVLMFTQQEHYLQPYPVLLTPDDGIFHVCIALGFDCNGGNTGTHVCT